MRRVSRTLAKARFRFLGNLDEVMEASDSEGGSWRAFIQLWWDRFGSAEVSVSDLIGFAKDAEARAYQ